MVPSIRYIPLPFNAFESQASNYDGEDAVRKTVYLFKRGQALLLRDDSVGTGTLAFTVSDMRYVKFRNLRIIGGRDKCKNPLEWLVLGYDPVCKICRLDLCRELNLHNDIKNFGPFPLIFQGGYAMMPAA